MPTTHTKRHRSMDIQEGTDKVRKALKTANTRPAYAVRSHFAGEEGRLADALKKYAADAIKYIRGNMDRRPRCPDLLAKVSLADYRSGRPEFNGYGKILKA